MKFIHATINVRNMEESLKFYTDIVGLPIAQRLQAGPNMEIAFLGEGETLVELICNNEVKDIGIGKDISLGFSVESMDAKMEFIKEKGLSIHSGPFQPNPSTRFFFVLDPNGLRIQFIEHK